MDDLLLMDKNNVVMVINVDEGRYDIVDEKKLPFQLKGKLREIESVESLSDRQALQKQLIAMNKNYQAVISFLASRVLPLTRENAKKIYALFGFEQMQDDQSKSRIALVCRAVSLQDNYWVKTEKDPKSWEEVDLRTNPLSEIVAQVSLPGSSLTIQGDVTTPELNGQGAYAKAWKREQDGLYLHKVGARGDEYESRIEVMVSNILDKCNVEHVRYLDGDSNGVYTCKCKCMTTEDRSILPGMDFISYCNVNRIDPDQLMMEIDAGNICKMWIVDYLISNRDRHGMNWGFYYDADSMEILKCHPLFDHNNAFDRELMYDHDARYLFDTSMTMREAAKKAMENVDFHFTDCITKEDFMDQEQWRSFMERADELGIETELAHGPTKDEDITVESFFAEKLKRLSGNKSSGFGDHGHDQAIGIPSDYEDR